VRLLQEAQRLREAGLLRVCLPRELIQAAGHDS
jgi:hypothetical protein